ncbi:uncharacterized protein LOC143247415 isoform X2 [Tachypleus tridentatus]|uniref:uncharacterized protein LOC143247415 isoform X2 n=1 Tax=Tachypleus tridentatus TaxID=6853 RepID=UPI003FD21275
MVTSWTMTIPTMAVFTTLWLAYTSPCSGLSSSSDKNNLETPFLVKPYWYSTKEKVQFLRNIPHQALLQEWLPKEHSMTEVDEQLDSSVQHPLLTESRHSTNLKRSSNLESTKNTRLLRLLNEDPTNLSNAARFNTFLDVDYDTRQRRKFPEVDSRGFDEDIFDEGFGEWSPMKRSKKLRK